MPQDGAESARSRKNGVRRSNRAPQASSNLQAKRAARDENVPAKRADFLYLRTIKNYFYLRRRRRIRRRLCSVAWLQAHAQFQFYISFLCSAIYCIALLLVVAKKRVCAPVAHKIEYVHVEYNSGNDETRDNARRTDRASALPQLLLTYALASISCEHCRSSRNNPYCASRHVIYYFSTPCKKGGKQTTICIRNCIRILILKK